jgi:hypothetical protein
MSRLAAVRAIVHAALGVRRGPAGIYEALGERLTIFNIPRCVHIFEHAWGSYSVSI